MPNKSKSIAQLCELTFKDFESLFLKKHKFKVHFIFENTSAPKMRGNAIVLPTDFKDNIIVDDNMTMFTLLVLSHELAHYIHKHNHHRDKDSIDSQAIELWADFFGIRIALTILNFRSRANSCFSHAQNGDDVLRLIGLAIKKLSETYYATNSNKYPDQRIRTETALAGVTSFFTRLDGAISVDRHYKIINIISTQIGLSDHMDHNATNDSFLNIYNRVRNIHIDLMNGNTEISRGVQPAFRKYIGTYFV